MEQPSEGHGQNEWSYSRQLDQRRIHKDSKGIVCYIHAFTLATKFVEGINDRAVPVQVDYQTRGGLCPFYRGHPGVHLQYCYQPAFRINHKGNEKKDHPSKHP